jgi:alpha-1,3-mannosyltransferase
MPLLTASIPRTTRNSKLAASSSTSAPPSLLSRLLSPPRLPFSILILLSECALCYLIITKISYTEIDWVAYMQEVEGYKSGERDYTKLRGDTGPLVYPAGFIYVYDALRYAAGGDGTDIRIAQWIFGAVYVVNSAVVMMIYNAVYPTDSGIDGSSNTTNGTTNGIKYSIAVTLLSLSKRIHSIYVLRCFNDTLSTLLVNVALLLFVKGSKTISNRNHLASVIYSLSVSMKMNTLLYAPAILLYYLQSTNIQNTTVSLSICAGIQLVLGYPFLSTYPVQYLRKAFELDRVFTYKWTVNFKFLPEDIFVSKPWSGLLLSMHVLGLVFLTRKYMAGSGGWLSLLKKSSGAPNPRYVAQLLFSCNFLGIMFSRTLHYQFYSWYFDSIPLLLLEGWWGGGESGGESGSEGGVWRGGLVTVVTMGASEYAFNVYPATPVSSGVLQAAHAVILVGIMSARVPKLGVGKGKKIA